MAVARSSEPVTRRAEPVAATVSTPAVVWWALIGGVCLAFATYVMVAWVTGPYFQRVPYGPSQPPTWMKVTLITWQSVGIPVALGIIWFCLVRPWRRERRVTFDGLLSVSVFLVAWQDPLSSYFNHWYTYNAYLVNMGSWVKEIPGWMSFAKPGAMDLEPIIWTPFMYVYLFMFAAVFGCAVMRRAAGRWPGISAGRLIVCAFGAGAVVDVVAEGLLIMPAGIYTYAGGHLALFPEAYHKFPLTEPLTVGTIFAGLASLRYFKDDQGQTVVERGVDRLKVGEGSRTLLRFLAVFGMCNVLVLCCYNVPNAIIGAHSSAWPRDLQERSYLTDRICGPGTNRACPGPDVPVTWGGQAPPPPAPGTEVPFAPTGGGPFTGPLF